MLTKHTYSLSRKHTHTKSHAKAHQYTQRNRIQRVQKIGMQKRTKEWSGARKERERAREGKGKGGEEERWEDKGIGQGEKWKTYG